MNRRRVGGQNLNSALGTSIVLDSATSNDVLTTTSTGTAWHQPVSTTYTMADLNR